MWPLKPNYSINLRKIIRKARFWLFRAVQTNRKGWHNAWRRRNIPKESVSKTCKLRVGQSLGHRPDAAEETQSVYRRYQRRTRGGAQCSRFRWNSTTALNRFTHIAFLISWQVVVGANETGPGRWTNEDEPVIQNIDNTPNVYMYIYI